ncbi:MAG TPA: hypothetical protein VM056_03665 [Terriglobales bacterium]|nr:hypothetical protein [Terriglobales bacterium]
MKSGPESAAVGRALEKDEFVSRKLIRPTLRKPAAGETAEMAPTRPRERTARHLSVRVNAKQRAQSTQEQTHAEDFYYQKQMAAKTLMTVVLKTGEVVNGVIEWYDRNSVKLNRIGKPNLLIYKPSIRYMHKSDEGR